MSMDYRLSLQTSYGMVTGINILEFVPSDTQIALFESKYLFQTFFLGIHGKISRVYKQYNFTRLESSLGLRLVRKLFLESPLWTGLSVGDISRLVNHQP